MHAHPSCMRNHYFVKLKKKRKSRASPSFLPQYCFSFIFPYYYPLCVEDNATDLASVVPGLIVVFPVEVISLCCSIYPPSQLPLKSVA